MRFDEDRQFTQSRLAGIDEAGRGCLAGPVVVACVCWCREQAAQQPWFDKLDDSKRLTVATRNFLANAIQSFAWHRIAVVHPIVIDHLNILNASLHGFELVAPAIDDRTALIVDGHLKPPTLKHAHCLVKGDRRISSVAAASVLAKVFRDKLMAQANTPFPGYGFNQHKGYATKTHLTALNQLGPCRIHRKSFAPVAAMLSASLEHERSMFRLIESATEGSHLLAAWKQFARGYEHYSTDASHRIVHELQRRGLPIMPNPSTIRPGQPARLWANPTQGPDQCV